MLSLFKNYHNINKELVKRAKEMDHMFKSAVLEILDEDHPSVQNSHNFNLD